jgi:hypothetical protein
MTFFRTFALMSGLAMAGLSYAHAQTAAQSSNPFPPPPGQTATQASPFPPPPGQQSSPFPAPGQAPAASPFPPPGSNSFPAAPGQANRAPPGAGAFPPPGGGNSVCEQFPVLRSQAEKDASAIKTASDRKATREEVCTLFNRFSGSEGRMVKFLETNQKACGVPADAIKQVKTQHARTQQIRKTVCTAAPAPRGPSLSDALSGPILPDEKPKPGRGTFDTLTGNALSR